jgi:hypothetical protein
MYAAGQGKVKNAGGREGRMDAPGEMNLTRQTPLRIGTKWSTISLPALQGG